MRLSPGTRCSLYISTSRIRSAASASLTQSNRAQATTLQPVGFNDRRQQKLATRHKFCAECVANDVKTHGFSIAYREHQPAFVRVCAAHLTPLLFGCTRCAANRKRLACGEWQADAVVKIRRINQPTFKVMTPLVKPASFLKRHVAISSQWSVK